MKNLNLKDLSQQLGKPELDVAKAIIKLLAIKAGETGITQKVRFGIRSPGL